MNWKKKNWPSGSTPRRACTIQIYHSAQYSQWISRHKATLEMSSLASTWNPILRKFQRQSLGIQTRDIFIHTQYYYMGGSAETIGLLRYIYGIAEVSKALATLSVATNDRVMWELGIEVEMRLLCRCIDKLQHKMLPHHTVAEARAHTFHFKCLHFFPLSAWWCILVIHCCCCCCCGCCRSQAVVAFKLFSRWLGINLILKDTRQAYNRK